MGFPTASLSFSPIRLAYKGFLLYSKATGGLSGPVRAPGSLRIVAPLGSLGLQSLAPQPQSEKSKMSNISINVKTHMYIFWGVLFKLILKQQIQTCQTKVLRCARSQMSNISNVKCQKGQTHVKYQI